VVADCSGWQQKVAAACSSDGGDSSSSAGLEPTQISN